MTVPFLGHRWPVSSAASHYDLLQDLCSLSAQSGVFQFFFLRGELASKSHNPKALSTDSVPSPSNHLLNALILFVGSHGSPWSSWAPWKTW